MACDTGPMHACHDLSAAEGGRPFRRPVWLAALLLWALACLPAQAQTLDFDDVLPVSYTHLTLPTILRV